MQREYRYGCTHFLLQYPFNWLSVSQSHSEYFGEKSLIHAKIPSPDLPGPGPTQDMWASFKPILFKIFWFSTGLTKLFWGNFWRNYFRCGNLSLLAPYFWLFQWCTSAPCMFVLWVAAHLGQPFSLPCLVHSLVTILATLVIFHYSVSFLATSL